jgi:hypothetical protein
MDTILLKKFEYDPEVYNLHTVKREFKKQKLVKLVNKYRLIDEVYFIFQLADLDEPLDETGELAVFMGPAFRRPVELMILIDCMLRYPPVYLKLVSYDILSVMLLKVLHIKTDMMFYPLCYVKLYLPESDKIRVMLKVYNPHTNYTKYLVNTIPASNEKQVVEYVADLNAKYASGEIDFNTISRTFLEFSDAVNAITEGW